ncbi:unnamed protein product, partial [Meganyctiphanes norvegica]
MSTSLIVLRFETTDDSSSLKHIEYKSPKIFKNQQGIGREASPSDFPYLKSDRLLSIHRGSRVPAKLCITTLEEHHIIELLTSENKDYYAESLFCMELQPADGNEASGETTRRCSSKESTPGAGSSKEGTPGPSEDGSRRGRSHKDRISFVSGNPMVEVTHGILHLLKK